jgi:hypothetical protein
MIEEVLAKLGEEDRVVIKTAIESEKTKGIESYKKAKEEANRLLSKFKPLEDSLIDNGFDLSIPLAEQLQKIKGASSNSSEELENLKREQRKTAKEILDLRTENERAKEIKRKFDNTKITSELDKAFGDKLIVKDPIIENLIIKGKVKLKDDDSVVFIDGDDELELQMGIDKFIASNPSIVKATQNQGSGEKDNKTEKKQKQMARSDFEKLLPSEKLDFFKAGGALI